LSQIETLIRHENEHTALKFRPTLYLRHEYDQLLRDIVALANADVRGERIIVLGVDALGGNRTLIGVPREMSVVHGTFEGLVQKHIEPPLRVRYGTCEMDGLIFGVLSITGCTNQPYLVSNPLAPALRRGEGWIRRGVEQLPLGRADLDRMYASRLEDGVFRGGIKVGFKGPKLVSSLVLRAIDAYEPPSAQAAAKLKAAIEAHTELERTKFLSTRIMRLTHLRLFGHEAPYRSKSLEQLRLDLEHVLDEYREEDGYYRFEELGHRVNFTLINRGTEPVADASVSIELPNGAGIEVAPRIFMSRPTGEKSAPTAATGQSTADYPSVTVTEKTITIARNLGAVACDSPVDLLREPLRMVITERAIGRRLPVRVTVHGRNLPAPIVVTLCIEGAAHRERQQEDKAATKVKG